MCKPRDTRHRDLFRPALDEIIDLGHPLVRLPEEVDWDFLDRRFASVCASGPGQPPLPSRLVAGLLILKHMHDLSGIGHLGIVYSFLHFPPPWARIRGWCAWRDWWFPGTRTT